MIDAFHAWYNTPLKDADWRWLLSGSRVTVLILLLILIAVMFNNGRSLRMMGRYLPIIAPLTGLAFYYFDQLFWDTELSVKITPAIIIFNLFWAWLILAASVVSKNAKKTMDEYAVQQRTADTLYGKRRRSVLTRRSGREKADTSNELGPD